MTALGTTGAARTPSSFPPAVQCNSWVAVDHLLMTGRKTLERLNHRTV